MKLTSNLRLRFAKRNNVISITTRTYEKASFDQFLAASIAQRCKTIKSAEEYIDSVTGKGSMNAHLKKLFREMRERSADERKRILESSLYPIEKIDDSQTFVFFPEFNQSLFEGKLYEGDLEQQQELLMKIVKMDGEFVSMTVRPSEPQEHTDNYRVVIDGSGASIQIAAGAALYATSGQFKDMVVQDISVPDQIKSIAAESVEGEGWFLLTASQINGPMRSTMGFYKDGCYYLLTNAGIKKTEIGHAFGLYLYRETQIPFTPANVEVCTAAANHLLSSKEINTFKTKSLVDLLTASDGGVAKKAINFVLSIKDSRELAALGLSLLEAGMIIGWNENSLKQMKNAANPHQQEILYALAPELYTLNDILGMDPRILTEEHRQMVEQHKQERETKIAYVKEVNGEVSGSALREKSGKLKNDAEVKEFRQLINKLLAHSKTALTDMDDSALDSVFRLAKRLKGLIPTIEAKIKDQGVE